MPERKPFFVVVVASPVSKSLQLGVPVCWLLVMFGSIASPVVARLLVFDLQLV